MKHTIKLQYKQYRVRRVKLLVEFVRSLVKKGYNVEVEIEERGARDEENKIKDKWKIL